MQMSLQHLRWPAGWLNQDFPSWRELHWTCVFPSKLSKVFHDSGKNLHAYILYDVGKFCKSLSFNMENFHEIFLKLQNLTAVAAILPDKIW